MALVQSSPTTLATFAPSPGQYRLATILAVALLGLSLAAWPWIGRAGPEWPAFLPAYQTAVILADGLTAVLMLLQFQQFRVVGLLILAGGYLFTALIAIIHFLSFPGLLAPGGVIGGGPQTTNFLWLCWHGGFPLFALAYTLAERRRRLLPDALPAGRLTMTALAAVVGLVATLGLLATVGHDRLPVLIVDNSFAPMQRVLMPILLASGAAVTMLCAARSRGGSVIGLWLSLTTLAFTLDIWNVVGSGARFSVGWYVGRINSVVASVVVLWVYVVESSVLLRHWVRTSRELAEANAALAAARREADRANQAKSRFLAAASHDLRQPVQSLILFLSLLDRRVADEGGREIVVRMDHTLAALKELLDGILDLSRLEGGAVRTCIETFPLAEVFSALAQEYAPRAGERGLALRVLPTRQWVTCDRIFLARMLRNFLENALRYTEHGTVLMGCRRRGDRVAIEVHDTGHGIPADKLAMVFEEFVQLGAPRREGDRGLGLGLATVKRIADLLACPLTVRSREGRGSAFGVAVLRALPPGAIAAASPLTDSPPGQRARAG